MQIQQNIKAIQDQVLKAAQGCGRNPEEICLVAVSKRKPADLIKTAIHAGQTHFGENYIQEAMEKIDLTGKAAATWHFIGHLQSNKAKYAVKYFDLIHTVDTAKLAKEIDRQAGKIGKTQEVLIQVNIAQEESKSGTDAQDLLCLVKEISGLAHLRVKGLMCMPPFFDDPEEARPYFRQTRELGQKIADLRLPRVEMTHLSMGMSNDFAVAIEEGATLVRVGTAIFGSRD